MTANRDAEQTGQPDEMSLIVQGSALHGRPAAIEQVVSRLEHIRLHHRSTSRPGFIRDLVLQDIGDVRDDKAVLYTDVLDRLSPFFPDGATPAFDNVFVGTLLEPSCRDTFTGYGSEGGCLDDHPTFSPYVDAITSPDVRDTHVANSVDLARQYVAAYPDVTTHWYITWEAFLPSLMRTRTYDATGHVTMGEARHREIRDAYRTYQTSLIDGPRTPSAAARSVVSILRPRTSGNASSPMPSPFPA